jgi:hypothetical protein
MIDKYKRENAILLNFTIYIHPPSSGTSILLHLETLSILAKVFTFDKYSLFLVFTELEPYGS